MAVIWLETFHNQFDVSDRKRVHISFLFPVRDVDGTLFDVCFFFPVFVFLFVFCLFFFLSYTCAMEFSARLLHIRRHSTFSQFPTSFLTTHALRTDTIFIIKAGCDSRTLWQTNFDGKSMPRLSPGRRYLRSRTLSPILLFFRLRKSPTDDYTANTFSTSFLSFISASTKRAYVYPNCLCTIYLFPLIAIPFHSTLDKLASLFSNLGRARHTDRAQIPYHHEWFQALFSTTHRPSERTDATWKTR